MSVVGVERAVLRVHEVDASAHDLAKGDLAAERVLLYCGCISYA